MPPPAGSPIAYKQIAKHRIANRRGGIARTAGKVWCPLSCAVVAGNTTLPAST